MNEITVKIITERDPEEVEALIRNLCFGKIDVSEIITKELDQ